MGNTEVDEVKPWMLISVISAVLNLFNIILITRFKTRRVPDILAIGLAVSDLCTPLVVFVEFYTPCAGTLGSVYFRQLAAHFWRYSPALIVTIVSIKLYLATNGPFSYRTCIRPFPCRLVTVLLLCWGVAIVPPLVITTPKSTELTGDIYNEGYCVISQQSEYTITVLICVSTHSIVVLGSSCRLLVKNIESKKKRILKFQLELEAEFGRIFLVMMIFYSIWTITAVIFLIRSNEKSLEHSVFWSIQFAVAGTAINPLLYGVFADQYREGYLYLLRLVFCKLFSCVDTPTKNVFGDFCDDCKGVRVFYFDEKTKQSDHSTKHTEDWTTELNKISKKQSQQCLEAGVIINCSKTARNCTCIDILWDCGFKKTYTSDMDEWNNVRILDMGPSGYRAPLVLCNICMTPLTGFSFRCTSQTCSIDEAEVYDLCYQHYNEGYHLDGIYGDHHFQCIMQSIFTLDKRENVLPLRTEKFRLIGLFGGAHVIKNKDKSKRGTLQRVVHKDGKIKAGLVNVWNCTAEVKYNGMKELVYEDVGNRGKVKIFAVKPGDGGSLYASHFPTIGFNDCYYLKEISNFLQDVQTVRLDSGGYCYVSQNGTTLTICNAALEQINWSKVPQSLLSSNLTVVDLMHNKLTNIPDELCTYKDSITTIGLAFNYFKSIPRLLFKLVKLEHLNFIQNHLSLIPKEIENFLNLRTLFLDNNRLRVLPDAVGNLKNLRILGLSKNKLRSLPKAMKELHSLHQLELHHNQFKVFPSVLCSNGLPKLLTLTMDNNRIQVIPQSAKNLILSLSHFTIHHNPIEIKRFLNFSNTNSSLLDKPQDSSCCPRGTPRVLLLGKSGSGKTSLAKAVVDKNYITPIDKKKADHTVGIDQYTYRFSLAEKPHEITLWDFAGDKCYAMMSQIFISSGSLIWLVFNMSKYKTDDENCFEDNIGIWLKGIRARTDNPTVWIIGTHADECDQRICSIIASVEMFLSTKFSSMLILTVSNAHDLSGHNDLHSKISELPTQKEFISYFSELKPHWSASEEYLSNFAAQKMSDHLPPIIKEEEALSFLRNEGCNFSDNEFKSFIEYLHTTGELVFFKGSLYLDVVWLIGLLREIFRSDLADQLRIESTECEIQNFAQTIKRMGTIRREVLLKIWQGTGMTGNDFNEITRLLSEFRLAFRVGSSSSADSYMFPWLLKEEDHDKIEFFNIIEKLSMHEHSILMVYAIDFIPPSFFEQLITSCSQKLNMSSMTRHMMSAKLDHQSISILWIPEKKDKNKGHIAFAICDNFEQYYPEMWSTLSCLEQKLNDLVEDWKGIQKPRPYIVCPNCVRSKEFATAPHLFDPQKPEGAKCVYCNFCNGSIAVEKVYPPKDGYTTAPKLSDLMSDVGSSVASKWKQIGAQLQIPEYKLDGIQTENGWKPEASILMIQEVFTQWEKLSTVPYTWAVLIEILQSSAIGEKKLAHKLRSKYP